MAKSKRPKEFLAGRCYGVTYRNSDPRREFFVVAAPDGGQALEIVGAGGGAPVVEGLDTLLPDDVVYVAEEIDPHDIGRPNADDAAAWMWETVQRQQKLEQEQAATVIHRRFGAEFTYPTDEGNLGVDDRVLSRFKKLHGGVVAYSSKKGNRYWYFR